jgi:cysteine sulfinate desulfinase/cysteine desulfurase-like protein
VTPSHVLQALGVPSEIAGAAIRLSVGSLTTDEAIDRVIEVFPALALKARSLAAA